MRIVPVDAAGRVYVMGSAGSIPTTAVAFDTTYDGDGDGDVFVLALADCARLTLARTTVWAGVRSSSACACSTARDSGW